MPQISVIIRALNEEKYLGELLSAVARQKTGSLGVETVLVDSGSTDRTQEIAKSHGTRITTISKEDFSFGRSLNIGCDFARGKFLVFISGHCIPCDDDWLIRLVQPLMDGCVYTYGRQLGRDTTKFSEQQLFDKYSLHEKVIQDHLTTQASYTQFYYSWNKQAASWTNFLQGAINVKAK